MNARLLAIGEYAAGAGIALATAFAVHAVIDPSWDVVIAMLMGSAIGMATQLLLGVALGALIGMFQIMISGSLIGMYGGMLFAMRDVMQVASWTRAGIVAIVFGLAVVAAIRFYDRAIRGPASARGSEA